MGISLTVQFKILFLKSYEAFIDFSSYPNQLVCFKFHYACLFNILKCENLKREAKKNIATELKGLVNFVFSFVFLNLSEHSH